MKSERGSATVLMLSIVAAGLLCTVVLVALIQVEVARAQAQGAADLAALSAASHAVRGAADPCAQADHVAGRNGAAMVSCAIEPGPMVEVWVQLSVSPLGWTEHVRAQARAGPVGL